MKKYWCNIGFFNIEDLTYWKLIDKNELAEVFKAKRRIHTGAETSSLLGMRHSHVANLQKQGLIKPHFFGKTDKKLSLNSHQKFRQLSLGKFVGY